MSTIGLKSNPNGRDVPDFDDAIAAAADALAASPTYRAECASESPELCVEACAARDAKRAYDVADFADTASDNLRRLVRMYERSDAALAAQQKEAA